MTTTTREHAEVTEDASRDEILEALLTANFEASHMESRDYLSRPSEAWKAKHRWINTLLTMLEAKP